MQECKFSASTSWVHSQSCLHCTALGVDYPQPNTYMYVGVDSGIHIGKLTIAVLMSLNSSPLMGQNACSLLQVIINCGCNIFCHATIISMDNQYAREEYKIDRFASVDDQFTSETLTLTEQVEGRCSDLQMAVLISLVPVK